MALGCECALDRPEVPTRGALWTRKFVPGKAREGAVVVLREGPRPIRVPGVVGRFEILRAFNLADPLGTCALRRGFSS